MSLPHLLLVDDKRCRGSRAVLVMSVGGVEFGIPLGNVHHVVPQLPTRPLPFGPPYLRETIEFGDHTVCVLDLAQQLGVQHREPLQNRKLVIVKHEHLLLALCVDAVRDPQEFLSNDVILPQQLAGTKHGSLPQVLHAVARTDRGPLAILDPVALLSPGLLSQLSEALSSAADVTALAAEVP